MLPDRVSNPGPLTYESGTLPIALRGRAVYNINANPELVDQKKTLEAFRVFYYFGRDECSLSFI